MCACTRVCASLKCMETESERDREHAENANVSDAAVFPCTRGCVHADVSVAWEASRTRLERVELAMA